MGICILCAIFSDGPSSSAIWDSCFLLAALHSSESFTMLEVNLTKREILPAAVV